MNIEAFADPLYQFDHFFVLKRPWDSPMETIEVYESPTSLVLDASYEYRAIFVDLEYPLQITASPGGETDPPSGNIYYYAHHTDAWVTATATEPFYEFDH